MHLLRVALLVVSLGVGIPALAQTDFAFGGLEADASAPVDVSADSLSIDRDTGSAVFSGNVLISQGEVRIEAGEVVVIYDEEGGDIIRLEAKGGVTFVTQADAAEAETAIYDLSMRRLTMNGNVFVTQGNSSIGAESMTVNLDTGAAQLDGRVRTTLTQQGGSE